MKHGAKMQNNVLNFWQKMCYFVKRILMKNFFLQKFCTVDIYIVILLNFFNSFLNLCSKNVGNA